MGLIEWRIRHGDILDTEADALVCSANVQLNLSGGVGGAILLRHGDAMQRELRAWLAARRRHCVEPGTVVRVGPGGTAFRDVFHAVAIDAFYQTTPELLASTLERALRMCAGVGARRVALTALATGYGRYPMGRFAEAVRGLMAKTFPPVESVEIRLQNELDVDTLRSALFGAVGEADHG